MGQDQHTAATGINPQLLQLQKSLGKGRSVSGLTLDSVQ